MGMQERALKAGVDIIVATPGRLMDHMRQQNADLTGIELLVLDEADRMMDMGFWPDVRRIIAAIPSVRQTLLFSATLSREIESLTHEFQHAPLAFWPDNRPSSRRRSRRRRFGVGWRTW